MSSSNSDVASTRRLVSNIYGTVNAPLAYRLRSHNNVRFAKFKEKKSPLLGFDVREAAWQRSVDELKEKEIFALKVRDERLREKKVIGDRIRRRVELGMEAFEEDLEARRGRLRKLLLREEASLARELVERSRKLEEQKAVELTARAVEVEEGREREKMKLVEQKKMQRFIEQNQELREAKRKAGNEDAKKANLAQIAEAEERRRREREDEDFWHDLQVRRLQIEEEREIQKSLRRAELERLAAETLRSQIKAKYSDQTHIENDEEKEEISALPYALKEVEEKEMKEKRQRLREDLDKQLQEAGRCLKQRRQEEDILDRLTSIVTKGETSNTREKVENRRREALAFMDSMREFREAVVRREVEAEECSRRLAEEVETKLRKEQCRERQNRKKLQKELKLAWDRQLQEKSASRDLLENVEDTAHQDPIAEEKAERECRYQAAKKYGHELLAQKDRQEAQKKYERQLLEDHIEAQRQEQEREEERMAKEIALTSRLKISGCT